MARFYDQLSPQLSDFIRRQHLFFTASAARSGRVNVSPKGLDSLRILDPHSVAYLDLTGSGNETAAHLLENGRLTLMFCSFEGAPMILRLYGHGEALAPEHADWAALRPQFPELPGARQIIRLRIEAVQTSCGMGVPYFDFAGERDDLLSWAERKGAEGLAAYRRDKNTRSIDGLPTGLSGEREPEPVQEGAGRP